jgi:hypothetical protein
MTSTLKTDKSALFICVIFLCLVGCQSKGLDEQASSTQHKDCTEIDSVARDKLVSNASKVNVGDAMAKVVGLLGSPNKEWPLGNKKGDRTVGTEIYYFTKKCGDPNRVFDDDHFVNLWFDLNGHLISISAHGVSGVSDKPGLKPDLH